MDGDLSLKMRKKNLDTNEKSTIVNDDQDESKNEMEESSSEPNNPNTTRKHQLAIDEFIANLMKFRY